MTNIAICARPRESIYRLIYGVIIWSAIARTLDDEKYSHVNEIPNVSIVTSAVQQYRDQSNREVLFFKVHSISSEITRASSELFVASTRAGPSPRRQSVIYLEYLLGENGELEEERWATTVKQRSDSQTNDFQTAAILETPPNYLLRRQVKGRWIDRQLYL